MFLLEKNRFLSLLMTFYITIAIFYVSSIPGSKISTSQIQISFLSEAYHFTAFFLFFFFLFYSIKGIKKTNAKHVFITLILSILYAISDELHQSFVPFRVPSLGDIFIDSLGTIVSLLVAIFISKKFNRQP